MAGNVTGVSGVAANQLSAPYSILFDSNNSLYIADALNDRIQKWTKGATSGLTVAGQSNGVAGSSLNSFNFIVGMVMDSEGNLYFTDRINHRVMYWANGAASGSIIAGITSKRDD